MDPIDPFETLTRTVVDDAVGELLPKESVPGSGDAALSAIAVVGFAGGEVRGSLGVAASQGGLAAIARGAGVEADDPEGAIDSLGELANLVLGHIKRDWSRRGVHVTLSTPLSLRGVAIEVCGSEHRTAEPGALIVAPQDPARSDVKIWLDYHCRGDIALLEDDSVEQVADQGDALFF